MMTNLMWKFLSQSDCWRTAIAAACLSILVLAFILFAPLLVRTHPSVYTLQLGLVIFLANLPMVFYHVARVQSKSESQIRDLQQRIEQLESQAVQQVA